jgi:hypothetical protein
VYADDVLLSLSFIISGKSLESSRSGIECLTGERLAGAAYLSIAPIGALKDY